MPQNGHAVPVTPKMGWHKRLYQGLLASVAHRITRNLLPELSSRLDSQAEHLAQVTAAQSRLRDADLNAALARLETSLHDTIAAQAERKEKLTNPHFGARHQDIIIKQCAVCDRAYLMRHIPKQAEYHGSKMKHESGFLSLEVSPCRGTIRVVEFVAFWRKNSHCPSRLQFTPNRPSKKTMRTSDKDRIIPANRRYTQIIRHGKQLSAKSGVTRFYNQQSTITRQGLGARGEVVRLFR